MSGRGRPSVPTKVEPLRGTTKSAIIGKQRTAVKEHPKDNTLKTGLKSSSLKKDETVKIVRKDYIKSGKNKNDLVNVKKELT